MIQLSYQQELDPYHTMFRLARLIEILRMGPLSRDKVRILDFYLLFPFRISDIRLSRSHRKFKKLGKIYGSTVPYAAQPADRIMFTRMEPIQNAALQTLTFQKVFDEEELIYGRVSLIAHALPESIVERISVLNKKEADLMEFLTALAAGYEMIGENELKARTGLMESRYDAV